MPVQAKLMRNTKISVVDVQDGGKRAVNRLLADCDEPVRDRASDTALYELVRNAATHNQGKVQLGEGAPVFGR
jgi:hypothetical protein